MDPQKSTVFENILNVFLLFRKKQIQILSVILGIQIKNSLSDIASLQSEEQGIQIVEDVVIVFFELKKLMKILEA